MDTLEQTTEPAGSDDVTSSPDTSVDETQAVESVATTDDGTTEETAAPEVLLAGKYKSPEELEKGYKELEKMQGTLGQKAAIADLIQEQYGMTPEQFKQALAQEKQQQEEQMYQANPGAYAVQKVTALENQLALREEESKLNTFLQTNPEYAPFKEKIFEIGLNLQKDKAYDEIAKEWFGEAIAKGQQGAYRKIEQKKMTQTTSTQSVPAKRLTEAELDNMSAADMEKILPWADTSYRAHP